MILDSQREGSMETLRHPRHSLLPRLHVERLDPDTIIDGLIWFTILGQIPSKEIDFIGRAVSKDHYSCQAPV